jgi:hypothetical protein
MYISPETIARDLKTSINQSFSYNFIPDTLPYACLYSDALKFPDKDAWLIPSTAIPITDPKKAPPMIIAELLPNGGWNTSDIKDNKSKSFYENSKFRFTALQTETNQQTIDTLYIPANIDGIDNSSMPNGIGRGYGEHGLIQTGENKYQYFNLVSKITIDISLVDGSFTNIQTYQSSTDNSSSFELDIQSEALPE